MYRESLLRRLGQIVEPSSESRLKGVQGLRALAAGSILAYHILLYSTPRTEPGFIGRHVVPHLPLGVTLLFVLSAFLLYRPFAAAILRGGDLPSLRSYLINRGLRILPAYWFILGFSALVLETTRVRDAELNLQVGPMDDLQTLLINAMFLQSFHPSTLLTGIGPAWALTDVVVFYLVLPVFILIASRFAGFASTRRGRRVATLIPAAMLLGIGLSGKAVAGFLLTGGAWDASWHAVVERSFWAHADMFALGLALATLRVDSEDGMLRLPDWWRRGAVAAVVLIAMPTIAFTVAEGTSDGGVSNLVYDVLMGVVCALFVALVVLPAGNDSTVLVRLLETPVIVAFGVVSYSVFLWQEPVIFWARDQGLTLGQGTGLAVNLVFLTALTFAVSALTYRFLEFPALMRKRKRRTGDRISRYRAERTPTP